MPRPGRLRIGLVDAHPSRRSRRPGMRAGRARCAPSCWTSWDTTSRKRRWPPSKTGFGPAFRVIIAANQRALIEAYAHKIGRRPAPDELEKVTWLFFESGAQSSAADYARAVAAVHRTGRQVARLFETLRPDAHPDAAQAAAAHRRVQHDDRRSRCVRPRGGVLHLLHRARQRRRQSRASRCRCTGAGGLPVGVQLIGRYG